VWKIYSKWGVDFLQDENKKAEKFEYQVVINNHFKLDIILSKEKRIIIKIM